MTNTQKLVKAINFISRHSIHDLSTKFFVKDDIPHKISGYFYDYHKGNQTITNSDEIGEEEAESFINSSLIQNLLHDALIAQEQKAARELRLAKFYE